MINHIVINCEILKTADIAGKVTGQCELKVAEVRKESKKPVYITINNISSGLQQHLASTLPTLSIGQLRQGYIERLIAEFEPSISNKIQQIFTNTRERAFAHLIESDTREAQNKRRYRVNENNPEAIPALLEMAKLYEQEITKALELQLNDTWPETEKLAETLQHTKNEHLLRVLLELEILKVFVLKFGSIRERIEILSPFLGGIEEAKKIARVLRDLLIQQNIITE